MPEPVKRWTQTEVVSIGHSGSSPAPFRFVDAADFDRVLAERDKLREAGERMARVLSPLHSQDAKQYALSAWRAASPGDEETR